VGKRERKEEKSKKKKKKKSKKQILKQKNKKKRKKRGPAWWKYALALIILGIVGYFGFQAWSVFNSIWSQNRTGQSPFLRLFGNVGAGELRGEGDGRINILILGIAGGNHGGRDLSDTNIVVSIDPINKKAAMLSLPRDMWVDIPGNGSCKLNAVHAYGEASGEEDGGPNHTKMVVSKILDLPIHYYIRLDFIGVIQLIDAIGGIDVNVKKDIYDPYFPDKYMSGYEPYSITAGRHHFNGEEALKYARSRYTTSDFDRASRQQQVIIAGKKKISRQNLLLEPTKLLEIIKIAKNHLKTDLQPNEIKRLAEIIDQINSKEVARKVLDTSEIGLLVGGRINGSSVLLPAAGAGNFTEIQNLAHRIFSEPYLEQEAAKIELQNGSGLAGLGSETGQILKDFGYNIIKIGDAKKSDYSQTLIIDYSQGNNPYTINLLSKRIPQAKVMRDGLSKNKADILIVLGRDFKAQDLYR